MNRRIWIRSFVLLFVLAVGGTGLAVSKLASLREAEAASANQPEPIEVVTAAPARELAYRATSSSIGTVLATRSITLRTEVPGKVAEVALAPGDVVDAGALLVALDVAVEEAELQAYEAEAELAKTMLERAANLRAQGIVPETELDRARAARDVALAQIARTKAVIARKTIRAPFRARVGIADVHPGQYLEEGALLTTLQGVDEAAHVDFAVAQRVADGLRDGEKVQVFTSSSARPLPARIVAIDARVDPATRNATVRARIASSAPAPGASVRVEVPVGEQIDAVTVPASALRKGPQGDHLFVIATDAEGKDRAELRRVRSGPVLGDDVVIYDGVAAGERVAASGSFKLREGVLVALAEAPVAAASN